ncbi:MAG: NUDIX domain-containing protein [Myxococcota bacterium]
MKGAHSDGREETVAAAHKLSAGLLMYRVRNGQLEVFLGHPGGPMFARKDDGHWTIPKGEPNDDEDLLLAAQREFQEETGIRPVGPFHPLGSIKQKGGKVVHAWACPEAPGSDGPIQSNHFEMQWPPGSGQLRSFPEMDRAQFFPLVVARTKLKDTQVPLVDRLEAWEGWRKS